MSHSERPFVKNTFHAVLLLCFPDLVGLSGLGYRSLAECGSGGRVEGRMSVMIIHMAKGFGSWFNGQIFPG